MKQFFSSLVLTLGFSLTILSSTPAVAIDSRGPAPRVPDDNFAAKLSGEQMVPSVQSDETGALYLLIQAERREARVVLRIRDIGTIIGASLHCGRAGETGPEIVELLSSDGCLREKSALRCILNADHLSPVDICGPEARPLENVASLAQAIEEGAIYITVDTLSNPGGELRGQMSAVENCAPNQASLFCDLCRIQSCTCNAAGDACTKCGSFISP